MGSVRTTSLTGQDVSTKFIERPSPNFGERLTPNGITTLVIHYTGMKTCEDALTRLCDPCAEVSAHILIDEDGAAFRLVSDEKRAWHAGRGYWCGITDINSASIGIELVNPGHEHGYRPFPDEQVSTLTQICLALIEKYEIPAQNVVGHSDIAPGRKQDPGELFPWQQLANRGIGLWPNKDQPVNTDGTAWDDLAAIGYATPRNPAVSKDVLDPNTAEADVIMAFQRRFLPHNLSGNLDSATAQRIAAVRSHHPKSLI